MKRLLATEGQRLSCTAREEAAAVRAMDLLKRVLRPRLAFYERDPSGGVRPTNFVGTIRLDSQTVLDVAPKTEPATDWVGAVVDLMLPSRTTVTGSREGSRSRRHRSLTDAVAIIYADRLESAFRAEGPLELIERRDQVSSTLRGKLSMSRWARTSILKPHRFPVTLSRLTSDNDFAAAMSFCAEVLARETANAETASRLRSLSQALRPGCPPVPSVNPAITSRPLPSQWFGYSDVWAVASALLRGSSLLGRRGTISAFDVAVESWPLLEELVQRTIEGCVVVAAEHGLNWSRGRRTTRPLLTREGRLQAIEEAGRSVEPDGVLLQDGEQLVVFEAKYRHLGGGSAPREHVFQALATAAAHGASTAVLVYPEPRSPASFDVVGHSGNPARLIVTGLDLFAYRPDNNQEAIDLFHCIRDL